MFLVGGAVPWTFVPGSKNPRAVMKDCDHDMADKMNVENTVDIETG